MLSARNAILALLAGLIFCGSSGAQSTNTGHETAHWYLGAAGYGRGVGAGPETCPYLCGDIGGWNGGAAASIGILSRGERSEFGIEGEIAIESSKEITAYARNAYYDVGGRHTFTANRRAVLATGLLRWGSRRREGRARMEYVGGIALESASETSTNVVETDLVNGRFQDVKRPDESSSTSYLGICLGANLANAAGRHADFVLGARAYLFARDRTNQSLKFPTPGSISLRIEAGVRWTK